LSIYYSKNWKSSSPVKPQ